MKSLTKTLCLLLCAIGPAVAHAQIFICKDASGRTISSDRPIPECADRTVRELGRNGLVKREIPAALTPEEKRQKRLQEEKLREEAAAAEEQRKSDRAILARYLSERDVEVARKRSIDVVQEQIKKSSISIAAYERRLKQAQADMEPYNTKQAKPPAALGDKQQLAVQGIKDETTVIQEREAEIALINEKYDRILKRYREITGVVAAK
jgi:hypothetical protein